MNLTDEEFIRRTIGPSHLPLKSLVPLTAIYSLFCAIGKKIILFPLIFDGFNIIKCKKFDFKFYQIFKPFKVLKCVLSGVLGNLATILVILKNEYMKTATNIYLLNLALTDIATLLICE